MAITPQHVFQQYHYDSFIPPKPEDDNDPVRAERLRVREELTWLDCQLWPYIKSQGWNIHRHRQKEHYVSSYHHIWKSVSGITSDRPDGVGRWQPIVNNIRSMWLHYGKSQTQLDSFQNQMATKTHSAHGLDTEEYYNAFYAHTRIQFYINTIEFRAWLIMTDKTLIDKGILLSNMKNRDYTNKFWDLIQPLIGKGFFYSKGDSGIALQPTLQRDHFMKFVRTDRAGLYSGIYKRYDPDSPALLRENIVSEMSENLRLLYPLYDLMAYKGFSSLGSPSTNASLLNNHFKRL
jgi:hypothetical protein